MKLTNVKAMATKVIAVGALAAAVVLSAPAKAEAQQFAVGVHVGYPYGYDHYRIEQERRAAIIRHEEWVRAHEYGRYHRGYYVR
jgi:hypothetical protein